MVGLHQMIELVDTGLQYVMTKIQISPCINLSSHKNVQRPHIQTAIWKTAIEADLPMGT